MKFNTDRLIRDNELMLNIIQNQLKFQIENRNELRVGQIFINFINPSTFLGESDLWRDIFYSEDNRKTIKMICDHEQLRVFFPSTMEEFDY